MKRRISPLAWLALVVVPLLALPSAAVTMIPNPLLWAAVPAAFELTGQLLLIGTADGIPVGGTVLAGNAAPGDTTLVFTTSVVTTGPLAGLPGFDVVHSSAVPTAAGTIPGAGIDVVDGYLNPANRYAEVYFAAAIDVGETSDPFFFTFRGSDIGGPVDFGLLGQLIPLGSARIVAFEPSLPSSLFAAIATCVTGCRMRAGRAPEA